MRPRRFLVTKVRKIDQLEIKFPEGGALILIRGNNGTGKSTSLGLIRTLLSGDNKPPIGEGNIVGEFVGADGETYTVTVDTASNVKGSRYFLGSKNGIKNVNVSDIISSFKYNPFTIEEFLAWGLTADGRKKQRNVVLDILGKREELEKLLKDEEKAYNERRDENVLVKSLEAKADPMGYEELNRLVLEKAVEYRTKEAEYNERISAIEKELERAKTEKAEELAKISQSGSEFKAKRDVCEELEGSRKKWAEKDAMLTEIRAKKDKLMSGGFDDVIVKEEGLYVKHEGRELPLDEKNVATSKLIDVVARIALMANKTTPIVLVSRMESQNTEMKRALNRFCKENDCYVIGEQVDESYDNVVAEIFEEHGKED